MAEPTSQRLHALDALRGVAALAVVFWHWQHFFFVGSLPDPQFVRTDQPFYRALQIFYLHGDLAVDLFFLLSGFVFFWLYSDAIGEGRIGGRRFFWLRFSRLYPLHAATLCLVAAGQHYFETSFGRPFVYPCQDTWHFVLNVLLVPSIGLERCLSYNAPIWSVSVEVVLYASFFLVCWLRIGRPWVLLGLSAAGFLVMNHYYVPLSRGVGAFFLGGCTCWLYQRLNWSGRVRALAAAMLGGIALAGWSLVLVHPDLSTIAAGVGLPSIPARTPIVTLFPVTVLALALMESEFAWLPRIFEKLSILGDISYSAAFPLAALPRGARTSERLGDRHVPIANDDARLLFDPALSCDCELPVFRDADSAAIAHSRAPPLI